MNDVNAYLILKPKQNERDGVFNLGFFFSVDELDFIYERVNLIN